MCEKCKELERQIADLKKVVASEEEIMKINNYDTRLAELLDCPFCGSEPICYLQGNNHTPKRSITVKCPKCLISRTTGVIKQSTEWLEEKAIELWNNRAVASEGLGVEEFSILFREMLKELKLQPQETARKQQRQDDIVDKYAKAIHEAQTKYKKGEV